MARELTALADTGVEAIRWFLFCDGRAGIRFDERGRPAGVDEFVMRDIDAALELAAGAGLRVMFVLLDFHWCLPARTIGGVQMGGRAGVLEQPDARADLLNLVLRPVIERYATEESILAWDLFNEPEWVKRHGLHDFLGDAIQMIRTSSSRPVTIGSAGARWRRWHRGLDVDYAQVHWYDKGQPALETPVTDLGFERPVWLGEFPTRGSRLEWPQILEAARSAGYAGAFYWSALSEDACSDLSRRPVCKAG